MKMNKFKRIVATAMMTIMALGSSMTAFAGDETVSANGATGTGKSTNHLDTDYVQWTLPTAGSVKETFNFWVDPEDILAKADKLPDGTSAKDYHNENLVYFKVSQNGAVSYNSTSNSVSMNIKNYVSANVTVKATLTEESVAATRIPFAKDDAEIATNTTAKKASLLLKLNVGTSSNAILDDGAEAEYEVAGQPNNFSVSLNSTPSASVISYKVTPSANATWSSVSINLSGKASNGEVNDTLLAPQVELTWDIKPVGGYEEKTAQGDWDGSTLWLSKDGTNAFSASGVTVEVSKDGKSFTALAAGKFTNTDGWISASYDDMNAALGGNATSLWVRVTDGKTRYTFH